MPGTAFWAKMPTRGGSRFRTQKCLDRVENSLWVAKKEPVLQCAFHSSSSLVPGLLLQMFYLLDDHLELVDGLMEISDAIETIEDALRDGLQQYSELGLQ